MKLEIEMDKTEAQRIIGEAVKAMLIGTLGQGLEVISLMWSSYDTRITITLEPQRAAEPA